MQFQRITYRKIISIIALFVLGGCLLLVYFLTQNKIDNKFKNEQTKGGNIPISTSDLSKDFISLQQSTGTPQTGNLNITGNVQTSGTVQGSSVSTNSLIAGTVQGSQVNTDSLNIGELNGTLKADQGVVSGGATTSDVPEGENKYYTDDRFNQSFGSKNSDNLTEGTTNQYYTDSRARGAISGSSSINYNSTTGSVSLPNSGVTIGTYGDGTHAGQFTVDAYGRVTSAASVLITGAAPVGAAGGDLDGNFPNPTIKNTWPGVTGISTVGTITTGTWNAGAVTSSGAIQGTSLNVGAGTISGGTINGATISGGTLSGGNVQGGTLTASAVNGVTTGNILVSTGSYANPAWLTSLDKSKVSLGNVENTALSTWAGSSNITTLGTIGTGTWNGSAIQDAYISSATNWNTAYNERNRWDGGATGLNALTGRTSLGLGTMAVQNTNNVAISGGAITGTTTWNAGAVTSSGAIQGASLNVGSGIITSGAINGQTISSNANFTGTVAVATSITVPVLQNNSADLTFQTNTSGDIVLSPAGNVGIGTANPGEKLTVQDGSFSQTISSFTPQVIGSVNHNTYLDGADGLYVSGKYAYVAAGDQDYLSIVDISDPTSPTIVSSLTDGGNRLDNCYGVYVSGKYAYVAAGYGSATGRLTIVDVSNPSSPAIAGSLASTAYLKGALHIYISGNYAYITAPGVNGFTAVDISDPYNPKIADYIQDSTYLYDADGLYVSGRYAYVMSHQSSGSAYLNVIDISNPYNISKISSLNNSLFIGGDNLYVSGKYAYIPSVNADALAIVDVSDPSAPSLTGSVTNGTLLDGADFVYVSGKYAYVAANFSNTLVVIDVSNPASPSIVGSLTDGTNLGGIGYVWVAGKYAYATALSSNRLTVVDLVGIDSPTASIGDLSVSTADVTENIEIGNNAYVRGGLNVGRGGVMTDGKVSAIAVNAIGNIPTTYIDSTGAGSTNPSSLYVQGQYVYEVNKQYDLLLTFDKSNLNPNIGSVSAGTNPTSVYVSGRYAYVTDSTSLLIYDVSNPKSPSQTGSASAGTNPTSVYVSGRYAYVTNNTDGLKIFDVSDPSSPSEVGNIGSAGINPSSIYVQGRYAYLVNIAYDLLLIYDVSNPKNPSYTGSVSAGTDPASVYVSGRYAYVTNNTDGLKIFDVSDPSSPSEVGNIGNAGLDPTSVYVQGKYAYIVGTAYDYLLVYDISDPATPSNVGSVLSGTDPASVYVSGRYAYVANNADQIYKFDFGNGYIQQFEAGGLEVGTVDIKNNIIVNNDASVGGGLNVAKGINISGLSSIYTDAASNYVAKFINDGNNTNRYGVLIQTGEDTPSGTNTLLQFNDGDGTGVGSITFDGTQTYYNTTSDIRLKENIVDTAVGIDTLMGIKIRDFNFRSDYLKRTIHGVVAQELLDVYPDAVVVPENPEEMMMVDYSKLTPLIIKSIQDQQSQINQLTVGNISGDFSIKVKTAEVDTLIVTGDATFKGTLTLENGLKIDTKGEKPECDIDNRGTLWVTRGGSGVEDITEICIKGADDTYLWKKLY